MPLGYPWFSFQIWYGELAGSSTISLVVARAGWPAPVEVGAGAVVPVVGASVVLARACPLPNWTKIAPNAPGCCSIPLQTSETTFTSG